MNSINPQENTIGSGFFCSLVIATLHDDGDLEMCLTSLCEIEGAAPFEVIVVDQNGDDRLVPVIAKFADRLTIVYERVAFRGACRARNIGAHLARGQWLGFPDDDCQLLRDVLREVERYAADPAVQIVTGQTIDDAGLPNVMRWRQAPFQFDRWSMFRCVTEATLFLRRDKFLAAGGFDERFGPGAAYPAAEGVDLVNRVFDVIGDGKAWFNPQIKMKHPTKIPPWTRWAVGRFHAYAIGDGALIAKSPRAHILNWGARTLASAFLQMFSLEGWRGAAFAARILGLLRGFATYQLARLKCRA